MYSDTYTYIDVYCCVFVCVFLSAFVCLFMCVCVSMRILFLLVRVHAPECENMRICVIICV